MMMVKIADGETKSQDVRLEGCYSLLACCGRDCADRQTALFASVASVLNVLRTNLSAGVRAAIADDTCR